MVYPETNKTISGECIQDWGRWEMCVCVFVKTQNRKAHSGLGGASESRPALALGRPRGAWSEPHCLGDMPQASGSGVMGTDS